MPEKITFHINLFDKFYDNDLSDRHGINLHRYDNGIYT